MIPLKQSRILLNQNKFIYHHHSSGVNFFKKRDFQWNWRWNSKLFILTSFLVLLMCQDSWLQIVPDSTETETLTEIMSTVNSATPVPVPVPVSEMNSFSETMSTTISDSDTHDSTTDKITETAGSARATVNDPTVAKAEAETATPSTRSNTFEPAVIDTPKTDESSKSDSTSEVGKSHDYEQPIIYSPNPKCISQKSCSKCIRIPGCVWCKDPNFENKEHENYDSIHRCDSLAAMNYFNCTDLQIIESSQKTLENKLTQKAKLFENGRKQEARHISPQRIRVTLSPGKPVNVTMNYLDAEDKPLDLYYVMDLSATMKDDKETVARAGYRLVDALRKITSNVQIGFGSFIDKPLYPFVSLSQLNENGHEYAVPYGFKNHLKLTDNTSEFINIVNAAKISQNLDSPEGTLDAIMQAIACNDNIGWRTNSTKLLVVSTDGPFHIAGDGKLAGIVEPNDKQCHMLGDDFTHSIILDYPSIAQLNSKVKETQVHVIFAVTDHVGLYTKLQNRIDNSIVVQLTSDSSNMVDVVRQEYQNIRNTLNMTQNPQKVPGIAVTYFYSCNESNTDLIRSENRPVCPDIGNGTMLKFIIQLELTEDACEQNTAQPVNITICPFGLCLQESLVVEVEPICSCSCETENQIASNTTILDYSSRLCSGSGNMSCGICECDSEHQGRNCECLTKDSTLACRKMEKQREGIEEAIDCSGQGTCVCKRCVCSKPPIGSDNKDPDRYVGDFCEFDTNKCKASPSDKVHCSANGTCIDDACQCNKDYSGTFCDCPKDEKMCMEPNTNGICSGHGSCECPPSPSNQQTIGLKRCKCNQGYTGLFCHNCKYNCEQSGFKHPICNDRNVAACAICHFKSVSDGNTRQNETQPMTSQICKEDCRKTESGLVIEDHRASTQLFESLEAEVLCTHNYKNWKNQDCRILFRYYYKESETGSSKLNLVVKEENSCDPKPQLEWIIMGVVGAVLLIGILLLLIWKVCTHVHDKREYKKFETERKDAKWGQADNPLYDSPTSNFINPVFRG